MNDSLQIVLTMFRSRDQGLAAVDALRASRLGGDTLLVAGYTESPEEDSYFVRDACRRGAIVTHFVVGEVCTIATFFSDASYAPYLEPAVVGPPMDLDPNSLVGGLVGDARAELERMHAVFAEGIAVLAARLASAEQRSRIEELLGRYGGGPVPQRAPSRPSPTRIAA